MRRGIAIAGLIFVILAGTIKYVDIVRRYDIDFFDYLKYSRPLSDEERSYLEAKALLYGIDTADEPFAFVSDESGQNTGILVDYMNQLSVALEGDFEPAVASGINVALNLKDRKTDVAVLKKSWLLERVFLYSQPFYTERSKILVAGDSAFQNAADLSDVTVAVISGSTAHRIANEYFKESDNVSIFLTASLNDSFYRFSTGEVDAILGDEAKISYFLNNGIRSNRFKFLDDALLEEDIALAVNPEDTMLLDILNKGILEMKRTNQYGHIHSKWFSSFVPETDEPVGSGAGANALIVFLAMLFAMVVWNGTVRNQVNTRTRELAESREELRELVDSLRDGIMVTDAEGVVQVCNSAILDFLGIKEEGALGRKLGEIAELEPFLEHAGGESIYTKDGRDYLVYHRKLNVSSNDELIFIDDYTERHKVESLNSQEAKMIAVGELSAGLAHEIRNPLGLIKSYLFVLKRKLSGEAAASGLQGAEGGGVSSDDAARHAISVMDESADRINKLIENLLGFSRLSPEKSEEIDIRGTVEEVLSLEGRRFEKNGIELRKSFELPRGDRLKINGDVLRLCLANLTNNSLDAIIEKDKAARAMEEGGAEKGREHSGGPGAEKYIAIELRDMGESLLLEFSDSGTGIPPDKLDAIFNPFYTTKESGTGLGLYILHSELRGIGGSIKAESEPGKGALFRISLPIDG